MNKIAFCEESVFGTKPTKEITELFPLRTRSPYVYGTVEFGIEMSFHAENNRDLKIVYFSLAEWMNQGGE